jgi:hypothetical protein
MKANEMHHFSDLFDQVLYMFSGFGGLVVSVLASGTQDRGFNKIREQNYVREQMTVTKEKLQIQITQYIDVA